LSTTEANGHASKHGFYTQSQGVGGLKLHQCKITNVLNGGILGTITGLADEMHITNSYFENCSHFISNSSTSNILSTKVSGNTINECGLTSIGSGVNALGVYKDFTFSNNTVRNTIFHFNGVQDLQIIGNNFTLIQNDNHNSFGETEITPVASHQSMIAVGSKGCSISGNTFTAYYEDELASNAIHYSAGNVNGIAINLSINSNIITDFGGGIKSQTGGTSAYRKNINISDNYIQVKEAPLYGSGIGILDHFSANISNNNIESANLIPSIKVYGNTQDPIIFGSKVTNNLCIGSTYERMIDVFYRNNIIEGNVVEGDIGYTNAASKLLNIVGLNRQLNRDSRIFTDIIGN
jgi:hypothetical protein